jgi:hypothetical protein
MVDGKMTLRLLYYINRMKSALLLLSFYLALRYDEFFSVMQPTEFLLDTRKTFFFHQLGASCKLLDKSEIRICIETGEDEDSWRNLKEQARIGCEKIIELVFDKEKVRADFEDGFYMEGASQGGLILRQVYMDCMRARPLVRKMLTYGTPNLGIDKLPYAGLAYQVGLIALSTFVPDYTLQNKYSFFQYHNKYGVIRDSRKVIKDNPFADFVSDLLERKKYKTEYIGIGTGILHQSPNRIYDNLEQMINIEFSEDKTVMPSYSATFGITKGHETTGSFLPFDKVGIKENVGLEKLWRRGGMVSCVVKGEHLSMYSLPSGFRMSNLLRDIRRVTLPPGRNYSRRHIYQEQAKKMIQNAPKGMLCRSSSNQTGILVI